MKILHIAAGLDFGGIAEVAAMLALYQQKLGNAVTLVTIATAGEELISAVDDAKNAGVKLVRFTPSCPKALFFSREMLNGLDDLVKSADVVHVHSNWTFPVWWGCRCAIRNGKKLVMTPHGCLSPERLSHSKWKKKLVGIFDRYYLKKADVIHATCEAEAHDIRKYVVSSKGLKCESSKVTNSLSASESAGSNLAAPLVENGSNGVSLKDAKTQRKEGVSALTNELMNSGTDEQERPRIVVVPNGIALESFDGEVDHEFWKKRFPQIGERKIVLALGRLHPLKGLDLLINAAHLVQRGSKISSKVLKCESSKVCGEECGRAEVSVSGDFQDNSQLTAHNLQKAEPFKDWILLIAGPDEQGTLEQLKLQVGRLKLEEFVVFADAIQTSDRRDAISSAHCLVLPSRHENFGLTVVEALACRVPVIATKGTPWAELQGFESAQDGVRTFSRKGAKAQREERDGGEDRSQTSGIRYQNVRVEENSSFITHHSSFAASGRCGWWVDVSSEALAEALREVLELPEEERAQMGVNGRKLVEKKYQWSSVAAVIATTSRLR